MTTARRFPVGTEWNEGAAEFRFWAPAAQSAAVVFADTHALPLSRDSAGYFQGRADVPSGTRYKIRLDTGVYPDPTSRFQPEGPHGWSEIVDAGFAWTDADWRGIELRDAVIYELHLGTFTREGTWEAAMGKLPHLAELGVTMIQLMPIAEFPGKYSWGYDGVDLFAPAHTYGRPEQAKTFIDRAHALGIAVVLDVVYNHLGPDGNYLHAFAPPFFSRRYANEWGEALNFDGDDAGPVREFFCTNARYWVQEFHFDGLRLDATQQMYDASPTHILAELADAVRSAVPGRRTFLIAENECQHARLVRSRRDGGYGLDAMWNDDFHHAAIVAATGRSEAYYGGYRGAAQEFVSCAKHGFLYQGQWYQWQGRRRGTPARGLQPMQFICYLQNHDQIANALLGLRLHQLTSPGRWRALTACLLLLPQIPMLFQGQEFAASSPFLYFADHVPELAAKVREGRARFLAQFATIDSPAARSRLDDPGAGSTFDRSKLDWTEVERQQAALRLHADLIKLRRDDAVIAARSTVDGAVLGESAFVIRYWDIAGTTRLLVVNLGRELRLNPAPEPLLAPCENAGWCVAWSSESVRYGGSGYVPLETIPHWLIPGESAHLLAPHESLELPFAKLAEKN